MKFINAKGADVKFTPTDIIAQALMQQHSRKFEGKPLSVVAQSMEEILDPDGTKLVTQTAPDDLPVKKIAADVVTILEGNEVLSHFSFILNVDAGEIVIDGGEDVASGHSANADKNITVAAPTTRDFFPKAIYQVQKLDHMTFLKGGVVVKFAIDRGTSKVFKALAQAILVGGIKNEDGTAYTAVHPIVGDTLATAVEVEDDPLKIAAAIVQAVADAKGDAPVVFLASDVYKKLYTAALDNVALLQVLTSDDHFKIVPTKVLNGKAAFVVVDPSLYTLGFAGKGIESLTDFAIQSNSQILESRVYTAGTLNTEGGAIVGTIAAAA